MNGLKRIKVIGMVVALAVLAFAAVYQFNANASDNNAPARSHYGETLLNSNFGIEIEGIAVSVPNSGSQGNVYSIEGLENVVLLTTSSTAADPLVRKAPGKTRGGTMVLRVEAQSGFAQNMSNWQQGFRQGLIQKRAMSVIFYFSSGQEVGRVNFYEAWPTKWSIGKLSSEGKDVLTEDFEITYEWMERV